MMSQSIRILFVCMGNICRSPTAEGVFRAVLRKHNGLWFQDESFVIAREPRS